MKFDEAIRISGGEVVGVSVANTGSGYTKSEPLNDCNKSQKYEELSGLSIEAISILGHPKAAKALIAGSYYIKVKGQWRSLFIVAEKSSSEVDFVYKLYWMECESSSIKRGFGIFAWCGIIVAFILLSIVVLMFCHIAGFELKSKSDYNKVNSVGSASSLDETLRVKNKRLEENIRLLGEKNEKLEARIKFNNEFYRKLKGLVKYESLDKEFDAQDESAQQP